MTPTIRTEQIRIEDPTNPNMEIATPDETYIPDGPWSDVMSFLLMDKAAYKQKKADMVWQMPLRKSKPTNLHFSSPKNCERAYDYCKNVLKWDLSHRCCDKKGFMLNHKAGDEVGVFCLNSTYNTKKM